MADRQICPIFGTLAECTTKKFDKPVIDYGEEIWIKQGHYYYLMRRAKIMLESMHVKIKDETFKQETRARLQEWIREGWNQGEKRIVDEYTPAIAAIDQRLRKMSRT